MRYSSDGDDFIHSIAHFDLPRKKVYRHAPPIPKDGLRSFTRPQPTNLTLRTKAPKAQGARDFVDPLPINCEMRGESSEGEYQMACSVSFVAGRHERVDVRRRRQPAIQAVVAMNL